MPARSASASSTMLRGRAARARGGRRRTARHRMRADPSASPRRSSISWCPNRGSSAPTNSSTTSCAFARAQRDRRRCASCRACASARKDSAVIRLLEADWRRRIDVLGVDCPSRRCCVPATALPDERAARPGTADARSTRSTWLPARRPGPPCAHFRVGNALDEATCGPGHASMSCSAQHADLPRARRAPAPADAFARPAHRAGAAARRPGGGRQPCTRISSGVVRLTPVVPAALALDDAPSYQWRCRIRWRADRPRPPQRTTVANAPAPAPAAHAAPAEPTDVLAHARALAAPASSPKHSRAAALAGPPPRRQRGAVPAGLSNRRSAASTPPTGLHPRLYLTATMATRRAAHRPRRTLRRAAQARDLRARPRACVIGRTGNERDRCPPCSTIAGAARRAGRRHSCEPAGRDPHCRNCPVFAAPRDVVQRESSPSRPREGAIDLRREAAPARGLPPRAQWLGCRRTGREVPPIPPCADRASHGGRIEGLVNVRGSCACACRW